MWTSFVKTVEATQRLSLSSYDEWKSFACVGVPTTANRPEFLYVIVALLCGWEGCEAFITEFLCSPKTLLCVWAKQLSFHGIIRVE